jgi:hypothetical protein
MNDATGSRAAKYRKRPVVIDAIRFTASGRGVIRRTNREAVEEFVGKTLLVSADHMGCLGIETMEGTMWASHGDWIIKGVQGEFYPCKPDIFEATYEPA